MMDDAKNTYKVPTPQDSLESQIMDPNFPKNEREWWAAAEITRLRAEVEALKAENAALASWQCLFTDGTTGLYHDGCGNAQCARDHLVVHLTAEVEALRADAERWRYINERNGEWRRFEADGPDPAYSMLCVRLPYDADLSCRATREIAIDAAIKSGLK